MSRFWCEQLGYVSHAPLGLSFNGSLWFCRQLQNGRLLALTQSCQECDPAIGKFQRIVMRRDLVFVDLPKDHRLILDYFIAPSYQACPQAFYLFSKRQLRPRKDADRHVHVFGCCEPTRARTKIACGELIANFRRPRFDAVETVVTHFRTSPIGTAPQPAQSYSPFSYGTSIKCKLIYWGVATWVLGSIGRP